jgi:hypothetical protein
MNLYGMVGNNAVSAVDKLGPVIVTDNCFSAFFNTRNVSFKEKKKKNIFHYTDGATPAKHSFRGGAQIDLILARMMKSSTEFKIKGTTYDEELKNLKAHIKARQDIVTKALGSVFGFSGKDNFYHTNKPPEGIENGMDPELFYDSVNNDGTTIGCYTGTKVCVNAAVGKNNPKLGQRLHRGIWIPGDWGYIKNNRHQFHHNGSATVPQFKLGEEGENIIHVGTSVKGVDGYWGHSPFKKKVKTMEAWMASVNGWTSLNGRTKGQAVLREDVEYPTTGLEVK